jgi:hypothetical protein
VCVCIYLYNMYIPWIASLQVSPPGFSAPSKGGPAAGAREGARDAARGPRRRLGAALLPARRHHGDDGRQRDHVDAPGMMGVWAWDGEKT